ncbi:MAG TPA: OmpA family protein [Steroidobacteraceae bacterium]|nr:OmpA family protein [Steroidobacteraceae bacterium]
MSHFNSRPQFNRGLVAAAVASALLAGCATAPMRPSGAESAREKLIALQTDPNLGNLAPAAMQNAEAAVRTAQIPEHDRALADYRVYLADRKIDIARAVAEARFAARQREFIVAQRTKIRLAGRTQEVDRANARAAMARSDERAQALATDNADVRANAATAAAAQSAQQAQDTADVADAQNAAATQQTADMQRRIDALQAKVTDRGLVLTLGDVLFATGRANLKSGATGHLDRLVAFLNRYPSRTAVIEGYTDNVGSEDFNQGLSERRAEAVRSYLTQHGVDGARLRATGGGASDPVAANDTVEGRQQNRRVEVTISDPPVAAAG